MLKENFFLKELTEKMDRDLNQTSQIKKKKLSLEKKSIENIVKITINSSYCFIDSVIAVTDSITQLTEFTPDDAYWIGLAVRESVINAIKHGNKQNQCKQVDVCFKIYEKSIKVSVRDHGSGFDINNLPNPLDPVNLLNTNGRGIFYMRTFMDEVNFAAHPDGGTIVKMVKNRPQS